MYQVIALRVCFRYRNSTNVPIDEVLEYARSQEATYGNTIQERQEARKERHAKRFWTLAAYEHSFYFNEVHPLLVQPVEVPSLSVTFRTTQGQLRKKKKYQHLLKCRVLPQL